jgi:hypothetical protein
MGSSVAHLDGASLLWPHVERKKRAHCQCADNAIGASTISNMVRTTVVCGLNIADQNGQRF